MALKAATEIDEYNCDRQTVEQNQWSSIMETDAMRGRHTELRDMATSRLHPVRMP